MLTFPRRCIRPTINLVTWAMSAVMITPAVASKDTFCLCSSLFRCLSGTAEPWRTVPPVRRCLHSCPSSPPCIFSVRFCTTFVVLEDLDFIIDTAYLMVDAKRSAHVLNDLPQNTPASPSSVSSMLSKPTRVPVPRTRLQTRNPEKHFLLSQHFFPPCHLMFSLWLELCATKS